MGSTFASRVRVFSTISSAVAGLTETLSTGTDTVTSQLSFLFPSSVSTLIVAFPLAIAVTRPVGSTVATDGLVEIHFTFLLDASSGRTVAVSCSVPRSGISAFSLSRDTPLTGTFTVTSQVAVKPPSTVVTVIVAVPPPTALTLPSPSTVATSGLLEDQLTAGFVAFVGSTVAVSFPLAPLFNFSVLLSRETLVTATSSPVFTILIAQEASWPPSSVFTVNVTSPSPTVLTLPSLSMVAIESLLEDQVTS